MDIKIKWGFIVLLFLGFSSIFSQCKKGILGCASTTYSFDMDIDVYPNSKTVQVGDTIWFVLDSPTSLEDKNTREVIDYSGAANLGMTLTFLEFDEEVESTPISAVPYFKFSLVEGKAFENSRLPDLVNEYKFVEVDGKYKFKIGIIPQKKGVFGISTSDAGNVYKISDPCIKAGFQIFYKAGIDQHLDYYQNHRPDYVIEGYEAIHLYFFEVYE